YHFRSVSKSKFRFSPFQSGLDDGQRGCRVLSSVDQNASVVDHHFLNNDVPILAAYKLHTFVFVQFFDFGWKFLKLITGNQFPNKVGIEDMPLRVEIDGFDKNECSSQQDGRNFHKGLLISDL